MSNEESLVGQPVRSLQMMLRVIYRGTETASKLMTDGLYGKTTSDTVSQFQAEHGLAVTGTTDQDTWERIVLAYDDALVDVEDAFPLCPEMEPGTVFHRGDQDSCLWMIQGMLEALSKTFASIPEPLMSGVMDDAMCNSICAFRGLCGLPGTPEIDKATWKSLAAQIPLMQKICQEENKRTKSDG